MCIGSKPKAPTPAPTPKPPPAPPSPEEVAQGVKTSDNSNKNKKVSGNQGGLNLLRVNLQNTQKSGLGLQTPRG